MKRARRPTKDTPTRPRARRARATSCPGAWKVTVYAWGRRYTAGALTVDALEGDANGGEVARVSVAWSQPGGSVPLADGVEVSTGLAELMRWLAGYSRPTAARARGAG